MEEWKKVKVSNLGHIVTGKTPKTSDMGNYGGNIPFLTPSDDMSVKYVRSTNKTLTEKGLNEVRNCLLPPNAVCVSCIGSDLGKVVMTSKPTVTNQQINSIIVDNDCFDSDFIYYSMGILGKELNYISKTSTAVPIVNKSTFSSYVILCPTLETQKRIASILNRIDDKIEINRRINDNLHQQAATLFKALFVDLTPFDGTMPPNWTISTLGDATEMGAGGDKPKESSPVKTPLCPYPIYSNGINDYGLYGYTNDPKIKVESVTVSARGTIGYVCLRHTPYVPIVRLVTLIPDTKVLSAKYLYLYLRQLHITGTGTTQQQLTVPDFRKTEIIIPDKNTMDSFTETVTPLFEQIWANEDENTKLAEVRDALLPKLMSGEIDVSDIQL